MLHHLLPLNLSPKNYPTKIKSCGSAAQPPANALNHIMLAHFPQSVRNSTKYDISEVNVNSLRTNRNGKMTATASS